MSSEESKTASPTQALFRSLEDQIPVLGLPRLIATQNMKGMLDDARARTRDAHRVQQEQYKASLEGRAPDFTNVETGEEMPGDITVTGDTTTTVHNHYTMPETKPSALSTGASAAAKYVIPALMAGVLGAGGTWLLSQWGNKPAPAVDADTDTNTQYIVEAMEGE